VATDTVYSDTLAVDMLEEFVDDITFYCSDGNREYDDKDALTEMEPCMPFDIASIVSHHDSSCPKVALCEAVPSLKEMMYHNQGPHLGKSGIGSLHL